MNVVQAAQEFGNHSRYGGWRLGYLVAACVTKGKAAGRPKKTSATVEVSGKVSCAEFARLSGTSDKRVARFLEAWNKAAEAGHVPSSNKLGLASEYTLSEDLPEWTEFYTSVSGGYNGGADRQPTPNQAKTVLEQLPTEQAATLLAETLDTEEIVEALDDEAVEHIFAAMEKLSGIGEGEKVKTKRSKTGKKLKEMTVVFSLIAVLNEIRDLAKEDSDSPLIKSCKDLMRETLEILDGIEEADDPATLEGMFSDFEDLLAQQ